MVGVLTYDPTSWFSGSTQSQLSKASEMLSLADYKSNDIVLGDMASDGGSSSYLPCCELTIYHNNIRIKYQGEIQAAAIVQFMARLKARVDAAVSLPTTNEKSTNMVHVATVEELEKAVDEYDMSIIGMYESASSVHEKVNRGVLNG